MRYLKIFEEFSSDEFNQVMMSICEDMPFEVFEDFPSTEDVRIYLVDGLPNIDKSRYEEYLGDDWHIVSIEYEYLDKTMVSFVKGDVNIAALKWMKDVYGELRREEEHLPSTEWGAYGEKSGISYNYTDGTGRKIMSFIVREGEPDPFDSNNKNTWKLKIYFSSDVRDFLRSCFGKKMDITGLDGHHSFVRVVSTWMKDVYGIKGVVRFT